MVWPRCSSGSTRVDSNLLHIDVSLLWIKQGYFPIYEVKWELMRKVSYSFMIHSHMYPMVGINFLLDLCELQG